jgi:alpha-tubulin suppressor-like RCC1 family protein
LFERNGQIGDGTTTNRLLPTSVNNASDLFGKNNIIQISSGYYHTCVLTNDGFSYCWGSNKFNF